MGSVLHSLLFLFPRKRQVIYDQLDKDIEEILLYTNEGEVLEGSQSNCFVVQNGVMYDSYTLSNHCLTLVILQMMAS